METLYLKTLLRNDVDGFKIFDSLNDVRKME